MHEPNISPLARRLAEENNVYWQHLMGTGPEGKVVEKDVIEYLHRVMAGEESINSTPEPLPVGLSQWPQENLANLVVPGQEQYGGEMHTSWQNEAISDLEDLEEAKPQDAYFKDSNLQDSDPSLNLVESQADSTTSYMSQSQENQFEGALHQDDLDDSLLLNDDSNPQQVLEASAVPANSFAVQGQSAGLHQSSGMPQSREGLSAEPSPEIVDANAFKQSQVDSYESDFTEFDTGLDGGFDKGLDSGFDAGFDTSDVDALLEQPINTTGFASVDDGLDYLDDDFGLDLEGDLDREVESVDSFNDPFTNPTDLTSEAVQPSMSQDAGTKNTDTIDELFYDETVLNESAFDAELDDLLFDDPDTGFEEPKATVVDSLSQDQVVLDQAELSPDTAFLDEQSNQIESLNLPEHTVTEHAVPEHAVPEHTVTEDFEVSSDAFSGFDDDDDFSLDIDSLDKTDSTSDDSGFNLNDEVSSVDAMEDTFSGLEPRSNTLESPPETIHSENLHSENLAAANSNEANEFDDLLNETEVPQVLKQATDSTTDEFDELLEDVTDSNVAMLSSNDDDLFAGADLNSLDTVDIDSGIESDALPELSNADLPDNKVLPDEFKAVEQVIDQTESIDTFDDLQATAFSGEDVYEAQESSLNLDQAENVTLSDFDIADTDFGSLEERLDDQSFATRDGIADSFSDDEDIFAAIDAPQTGTSLTETNNSSDTPNIAEDLLATTADDIAQSPEDKALADAFLDGDSFFEDLDDTGESGLFADDPKPQASSGVEEVDNLDFLDSIDLEDTASTQDSFAESTLLGGDGFAENDFATNDLGLSNDVVENSFDDLNTTTDGLALAETSEMMLDDFDLDSVDVDSVNVGSIDLDSNTLDSDSLDSDGLDSGKFDDVVSLEQNDETSAPVESDSFLSEFDVDDFENDIAMNKLASAPEQAGQALETEALDLESLDQELDTSVVSADSSDTDNSDTDNSDAENSDASKVNAGNLNNDLDRRFEEALDTAAEQADPYAQSQAGFNDDIFSDADGLSFSDDSFDADDSGDTTLTWSDVDLDAEDPLVELERELASELSDDHDFLNNDIVADSVTSDDTSYTDATQNENSKVTKLLGATAAAGAVVGAVGAVNAGNAGNNTDDKVGPNGENWTLLEEILEDDAEDILAEQAGDVEYDSDLFEGANESLEFESLEFESMEDFDLEASLNELESELMSDELSEDSSTSKDSAEFESKETELESKELESSSSDASVNDTQDHLQDEILNQMVDDSSIIDDVTASALLEEAGRSIDNSIDNSIDKSVDKEVLAMQSKTDFAELDVPEAKQIFNLQNYQVARRYVELTKLLAANSSIAQELQELPVVDSKREIEAQDVEAITPLVLLTKAAAKAVQQFPLSATSNDLLVSKFAKEGNTYLSLDNALEYSVQELVEVLANTAPDTDSPWITSEAESYKQQLASSHLVVADLSAFQLDELVTTQQKPVLVLGRIVKENDSYVSTLSLSGDVDLESASAFLARVAFLLSDPIRLLV